MVFKTRDCEKWEKSRLLYSSSSVYATRQVRKGHLQACALCHFWAFLLPTAVVGVAVAICLKVPTFL